MHGDRLLPLVAAAALLLAGCAPGTGGDSTDAPGERADDTGTELAPDTPREDAAPDLAPDDAAPDDAAVEDSGPPPACDSRFAASPNPGETGLDLAVDVTDGTPYAYVGLSASGPGAPGVSEDDPFVTGTGPYTWHYTVRGHAAGILSLVFTADSGATVVARCDVRIVGGTPPPDAGADADADADADAGPPPANRFGIGLVGPGDAADLDRAADLAGPGGWVKLIFPGVTRDTTGPDAGWVTAIREAYARDLVPVVRIGPPWGDNDVRNDADTGSSGLAYAGLAAAYRRVVEGLPLRDGWPLWVEVHNEPDLCGEWVCSAGTVAGDWIGYEQMAHEYAALLRDVADALHAIGDPRIGVLNGALAPGGARRCQCGGDGWEGGITALDYLAAMAAGVPGVFERVDGLASHAYPAEGMGWGFFVPFDRAGTGLRFFESELTTIGRSDLPVFLTETGWCTPGERCRENGGTRDEVAEWTARAYAEFWLGHASVRAVMPFMLRDAGWNDFAWVEPGGGHYPVYDRIRALRCTTIAGRCP
jgi:hypothetical protein